MTTSAPGPGESVTQWQGRILRRIQQLAAQHREVTDAGPAMFDDGVSGGNEQVWNERLELLTVQREHAEYTAMLGGVDPGWVVDARELGQRGANAPKPGVVRQHPARANQAQEFYLDMLELDLWTMERMAGLEAARMDRIATGRWAFDTDPIAVAQFADNMTALHTRVTVLAAAAQLTPAEGESLWGASVEGIRRVHAVTFAAYTEQDLARAWNGYARADPALAVPPYVPRGPDVGAALVEPPTPRTMIADATSALRSQLVDTAIRQAEPTDLAAESTAITAVVDAALGEDNAWSWEPDPDPVPGQVSEVGTNRGPDL